MGTQPFEARLPELPQPVRPETGTTYQQPNLISRVEPVYSRFARDARLQGTVQISAAIGTDGVPRSLARVSGNSALADMAIEAVRKWRYQPALLNGQPTEAHTAITFNFQLR
jgi:protein TonB